MLDGPVRAAAGVRLHCGLAVLWRAAWLCALVLSGPGCARQEPPAAGPMRQEVYVWQRSWTPGVQAAVMSFGTNFSRLLVLGAEVSWENRQPRVARAQIDFPTLRQTGVSVALCLRIGGYSGPFADNDRIAMFLASLGAGLVAEARSNGVTPAELQLDFDCATANLRGYGRWLRAMRSSVEPVPVTFTALPAWLDGRAFAELAGEAPAYVLQVHALQRPTRFDERFQLCDPVAARAAVARAGALGVPFRVALPTYAFMLAFDPAGQLIGVRAEGPAREWPANARTQELWADATEMATLVATWTRECPPALQGLVWYRLPVVGDRFNWRWPTLAATMQGRTPRRHLRVISRRVEAGLTDIHLANEGELDISSRLAITVRWQGSRWVAADALSAFAAADVGSNHIRFQTEQRLRLPAGEQLPVGWLRLSEDGEVICDDVEWLPDP